MLSLLLIYQYIAFSIFYIKKPFFFHTEGLIPKGAIYIGEQDTLEDGVNHTDTFYAVPITEEEEDMSLQSPTSPSEKKPLKYDGIGPTDDKGMPLSFRMVGLK